MMDRTLAHYRITERLGGGSMGVVYRAEDTKLKRPVALKFLPPGLVGDAQAKERFVREAQAASALDHPNICTIYEIGETDGGELYIAMACYDGETLKERIARGPLGIGDAVDVARQIASGLAKAHAAGIVHRDVKPANVLLTEGLAKILDFGLAKSSDATQLTQTGSSVGTPAYMSPEQFAAERVDHRADLWSLGVVLYEMLTGVRPFAGSNAPALIHAIHSSAPRPVRELRSEISERLAAVVDRLLRKDPGERYGSGQELLADLPSGSSASMRPGEEEETATLLTAVPPFPSAAEATPPPAASVAVLPFVNLSADPENEYFSDGLAADLILALGRVDELRVPARSTSFSFRDKGLDGRAVGRELGVRTVLEGSVQRAGKRLRVSVELIEVADGHRLWTERFDRTLEDIFAIQDEISQAVVEGLKVELLGVAAPPGRPPTGNAEAYDLYLKGRYFFDHFRTNAGLQRAVEFFEQAVGMDPTFALACAGLADALTIQGTYGFRSPKEVFPQAATYALKAAELDAGLAEAHSSLALIRTFGSWELEAAEQGFRRAIALNPRWIYPRAMRAVTLAGLGRYEEAEQQVQRTLEMEPVSAAAHSARPLVHLMGRRFDALIAAAYEILDLIPGHVNSLLFAPLVLGHKSQWNEAWRLHAQLEKTAPSYPYLPFARGYLKALEGDRREAQTVIEELIGKFEREYFSPSAIAAIHAALGDGASAKTWARKASSLPDPDAFLLFLPSFDALHEDPEFLGILREIGFQPGDAAASSGS